jgi:hypothetical protein
VAAPTPDAERIPQWYSVSYGILCALYVVWAAIVFHGSAVATVMIGVCFALLAGAFFWVGRRNFRKVLATPIARRGQRAWLLTLPSWLMALTVLAELLAIFALGLAVLYVTNQPDPGYLYIMPALILPLAWTEVSALIQVKRCGLQPAPASQR